jgi:NAD(P)H-hydrate repair Nnr-like enzyme with NAD(P)H-hydrate epimerase domain
MWIASSDQSKEIDRQTTEKFGIPSSVLMERAGLAVFHAVREFLPFCAVKAITAAMVL